MRIQSEGYMADSLQGKHEKAYFRGKAHVFQRLYTGAEAPAS